MSDETEQKMPRIWWSPSEDDWLTPSVDGSNGFDLILSEGFTLDLPDDAVELTVAAGEGAADARLRRLRHQIGEWAERINKHNVPDEFVSYVDADQRLLDIIWEMRDAAREVDR